MTPSWRRIGFDTNAAAAPNNATPAKGRMKLTPTSSESRQSKVPGLAPSITYKLSNGIFKSLGWTSLPENAIVVPVVTMKAKFSHRVISPWFAVKERTVRTYKNGKTLCVANGDGTGRIYYPNGMLAIHIKKGGCTKEVTRIIVKTPGGVGRDGIRRRPQLCAIFDSLGNGVVYDCDKKKRMVYDQNHGMAWLKKDGIPVYWKWHEIRPTVTLDFGNEDEKIYRKSRDKMKNISVVAAMKRMESLPDTSARVSVDSSLATGTRSLSDESGRYGEALREEGNYINTAHVIPARPIRPIIFQLNSYVGVHILSQSEIALTFFADGRQTRLNIGTLYNPFEKFDVDKVYSGSINEKVWCPIEVLPVKTRSMKLLRQLIRKEKAQPCWNLN